MQTDTPCAPSQEHVRSIGSGALFFTGIPLFSIGMILMGVVIAKMQTPLPREWAATVPEERGIHAAAPQPVEVSFEEDIPSVAPLPAPDAAEASGLAPESIAHRVAGVYLTPSSVAHEQMFLGTMEDMGESGGNALVFDVKGSEVHFDADAPLAESLGLVRGKYDLGDVLRRAHERGIYTIGRFVALKDAGLSRARPDLLIKHPTTGQRIGYEFVDPEDPTVLAYNREILCALAASGIDEINLDYIRFSTEQFGTLHAFSTEEKSRKVGAFVAMAREAIDACGPETALGLSTYAILGWNYEKNLATLGQDVRAFAPLVDVISPMAYPATFAPNAYYTPGKDPGSRMYYLVWRTLTGYQELLGPEQSHKLRPWIQGYGVTRKNMEDQMKAVADAGLCGFTVWNADNAYAVSYKALPSFTRPDGCLGETPSVELAQRDVL